MKKNKTDIRVDEQINLRNQEILALEQRVQSLQAEIVRLYDLKISRIVAWMVMT